MGHYSFLPDQDNNENNISTKKSSNPVQRNINKSSSCPSHSDSNNTKQMVKRRFSSYDNTHNPQQAIRYIVVDNKNNVITSPYEYQETQRQRRKHNFSWSSICIILLLSWIGTHIPSIYNHYQYGINQTQLDSSINNTSNIILIKNIILSWQYTLQLCSNDVTKLLSYRKKKKGSSTMIPISKTEFEEEAKQNIIGQEYAIATLVSSIDEWQMQLQQSSKKNNALMLIVTGPNNVGKTSMIQLLHTHLYPNGSSSEEEIMIFSGEDYSTNRLLSFNHLSTTTLQQEIKERMISFDGTVIIIQDFDRIEEELVKYMYYQIIVPYLKQKQIIIVFETSSSFGLEHVFVDIQIRHDNNEDDSSVVVDRRSLDRGILQSLNSLFDVPWKNMIHGIIPCNPLNHIHLKKILQNVQKSQNIQLSEKALHYLLSPTFIDYFTLQQSSDPESKPKIYATEGVHHLYTGSIRIMKRFVKKYSKENGDLLVLDYQEDGDVFSLSSCIQKDGDDVVLDHCHAIWNGPSLEV